MGFEMMALVTSPVEVHRGNEIISWARERAPFVRVARGRPTLPGHVVLGGIERTSYKMLTQEDSETALLCNEHLERLGQELSLTYACHVVVMETDCFGGACVDEGHAWSRGARVEGVDTESIEQMLRFVGVANATGYFEGFERGHFGPDPDLRQARAWLEEHGPLR